MLYIYRILSIASSREPASGTPLDFYKINGLLQYIISTGRNALAEEAGGLSASAGT